LGLRVPSLILTTIPPLCDFEHDNGANNTISENERQQLPGKRRACASDDRRCGSGHLDVTSIHRATSDLQGCVMVASKSTHWRRLCLAQRQATHMQERRCVRCATNRIRKQVSYETQFVGRMNCRVHRCKRTQQEILQPRPFCGPPHQICLQFVLIHMITLCFNIGDEHLSRRQPLRSESKGRSACLPQSTTTIKHLGPLAHLNQIYSALSHTDTQEYRRLGPETTKTRSQLRRPAKCHGFHPPRLCRDRR
jgi:hypothetical protein